MTVTKTYTKNYLERLVYAFRKDYGCLLFWSITFALILHFGFSTHWSWIAVAILGLFAARRLVITTVNDFNEHYIKQLKKYIFKKNSFFLLLLKNEKTANVYKFNIKFKIRNKFNFLVKSNETKDLSNIKFNLTFGDIDFINYI